MIVMGQLSPGSWVVEADLAKRLGMSRTPIRGALQWLQREGYVIEHKEGKKGESSSLRLRKRTRMSCTR